MARYVVGIDLGTTNSTVAYADLESEEQAIQMLAIEQVSGAGEVSALPALPSFLLLPTEHEVPTEAMALPWAPERRYCVGTLARQRGAELSHRLVSSAKSWLSYGGVDRSAAILPWRGTEEAPEDEVRLSPVEASARYLRHLHEAWDHVMEVALADQEILLTVPASFDAVARELTVAAAHKAGLPNITLLEEPQAAFYSWLAQRGESWRDSLKAGDRALVCDIGGGTCDFTLIAAIDDEGTLALERIAVGDHILLGGDNMDLMLAQLVIQRLGKKGKKLRPAQYRSLVHACRRAKEALLGDDPPEAVPVSILGSGSKLIGGTLKSELRGEDVDALLAGFFPQVEQGAAPKERRAMGLKELGLPYAADPAVTRHLSSFLAKHDVAPTALLWNGGVLRAPRIRQTLSETLKHWYGSDVPTLEGTDLDLAVAHGAAYYGLVRRGKGIRIRGGTARSYYIGVESSMPAIPGFEPPIKALCIAPFGMEEGTTEDLPEEEIGLVVGEATTFRFFASTSRPDDAAGTLIDADEEELQEIAPVEAQLPAEGGAVPGDVVPVYLASHVTEVGTLDIWCYAVEGEGRWKLEYALREGESES